jgi:hypothetical protein
MCTIILIDQHTNRRTRVEPRQQASLLQDSEQGIRWDRCHVWQSVPGGAPGPYVGTVDLARGQPAASCASRVSLRSNVRCVQGHPAHWRSVEKFYGGKVVVHLGLSVQGAMRAPICASCVIVVGGARDTREPRQ